MFGGGGGHKITTWLWREIFWFRKSYFDMSMLNGLLLIQNGV